MQGGQDIEKLGFDVGGFFDKIMLRASSFAPVTDDEFVDEAIYSSIRNTYRYTAEGVELDISQTMVAVDQLRSYLLIHIAKFGDHNGRLSRWCGDLPNSLLELTCLFQRWAEEDDDSEYDDHDESVVDAKVNTAMNLDHVDSNTVKRLSAEAELLDDQNAIRVLCDSEV